MQEILILGAGRVGSEVARLMTKDKFSVTVVDVSASRLLALKSDDMRTVQGNAADPQTLIGARVEDASMVVAVTAIDEVNLVACQICSMLSENIEKIARIRNTQYTPEVVRGAFGIADSFCPEQLVAESVSNAILHPGCLSVHRFADDRIALAGIQISPKAEVTGGTISDLRRQVTEIDYRIVSVYRDGAHLTPNADTRFFVGDDIYVIVATENLNKLTPFLAGPQRKNQRIMIAGGGNIGERVAAALEEDHDVKLIEISKDRSQQLMKRLKRTLVLKNSASDEQMLVSENIAETDIFCSLTNDEEENIMSAILAKDLGAHKTAVLINRARYANMVVDRQQADIVLSPSDITIGSLQARIRPGSFNTVHSLRLGSAEAVEVTVRGDEQTSQLAGREMQDIDWPEGTMPGAILRDGEIIIAHDETVIADGDRIICFVASRGAVRDIEKLIRVGLNYIPKGR